MSARLLASMLLRRGLHRPTAPASQCSGGGGVGGGAAARSRLMPSPSSPAAAAPTRPPHSLIPSSRRPIFSWLSPRPSTSTSTTTTAAVMATDEARCMADLRTAVLLAAGANVETYQDPAAFEAEAGISRAAVAALRDTLGHAWAHSWLLRAALTHVSWKAETTPSETQPLLAWIGDATLQGIATDELVVRYARSGTRAPSKLTVTRTLVCSRAGCARHARLLGLDGSGPEGRLMAVGPSFLNSGVDLSVGMLGEGFEAVLGAVYIDGGRAAARSAFLRLAPFPATVEAMTTEYQQ